MANLVESDTENHRGDHAGSERRADPAVIDGPGGLGEPRRRTARPIAHRSVSRTSSRCVGSEAPLTLNRESGTVSITARRKEHSERALAGRDWPSTDKNSRRNQPRITRISTIAKARSSRAKRGTSHKPEDHTKIHR